MVMTDQRAKGHNRYVAIIGDANDPGCHGGIAHGFVAAGRDGGFIDGGCSLDLGWMPAARNRWRAGRLMRLCRPVGYQYSRDFLTRAEAKILPDLGGAEVISLSQHFPTAASVIGAGGKISYYLDATAAQLTSGRGLDVRLPSDVRAGLLRTERANYAAAGWIIFWAWFAADSAIDECGADADRVRVVLPGANLDLPGDWSFESPPGRPGVDRPMVLGFVGKDWRRKGLPVVVAIRDELSRRGWEVEVAAAGEAPADLRNRPGVRFAGFIDKTADPAAYPRFLARCDLGCLFSRREALGLSILEFLRAGVPVAGYAVEGPAETIPPDAGFRFSPGDSVPAMADRIESTLTDEAALPTMRRRARALSPHLTWQRCVGEFQRIWAGESFEPFQLVAGR